jgi:anti-sigma factor RsiW
MPDCSHIDALVTPFVDGELPDDEQRHVSRHLDACAACRARVAAERTVRSLLQARHDDLCTGSAPSALKARCASFRSLPAPGAPPARAGRRALPFASPWSGWLRPLALAATLVIVVGGAFLYQATQSSNRVLAAELAADHMKCFGLNELLGTSDSQKSVEDSMASTFEWKMHIPQAAAEERLDLIGSRLCLYGEGRTAHIMFRHNGVPMSLFMLPRETRSEQLVDVFGYNCRIWSAGDRTFVLVSRESAPEMERVTAVVRATLK